MGNKLARYETVTFNIKNACANEIIQALNDRGAAIIHGIPNSIEGLLDFGKSIGEIVKHPHSDNYGITTIDFNPVIGNANDGGLGFLKSELMLHTDRSSEPIPPDFVIVMCCEASQTGGLSKLSDTQPILNFIKANYPEKYKVLHTACCLFGDTLTRSPVVSTSHGRSIVKFRYDSLGFYPPSTWDAIRVFLRIAEESAHIFSLAPGQMYIIDNHRVLHGRTSYSGSRKVMRLLVNTSRINRKISGE